MRPRVVVESPLGAPTAEGRRENLRFALWCCRAVELDGFDPIASHVVKPWWLDDTDPQERDVGIESSWFWQPDVTHVFFFDRGESKGMLYAIGRCEEENIPWKIRLLWRDYPEISEAYMNGEWPPHTEGFEIATGLDG